MTRPREWPPRSSRRDLAVEVVAEGLDETAAAPRLVRDVIERVTDAERPESFLSFGKLVASLRPGSVQLLAGPSGIGHQQVAWCVAEELARTRGAVLYASMELTAEELVRRVREARKDAGEAASLSDLDIAIDDRPALTLPDITGQVCGDRVGGLDYVAVVVDPVERLVPPRRGNSDEERLWALAMELGDVARACNVVVLATCATHPKYEEGWQPPQCANATDVPWQFRHEADALWLHHRESYFRKDGDATLCVSIRSRSGSESFLMAGMASGWPRWQPRNSGTRENEDE